MTIDRGSTRKQGDSDLGSEKKHATTAVQNLVRQESEAPTKDALSIIMDALNSSVSAMIITDLDGIIQFVNPTFCQMFDYGINETLGKDSAELFTTREVTKLIDVLTIIDDSQRSTKEFTVKKKDGRAFIVEVAACSVTNASGERVGRMASFFDITERKLLEVEQERRLQDALKQLKVLNGLLSICAACKKIKDDEGHWHNIEEYIRAHSEAEFTHGICPNCSRALYPEIHE